MNKTTYFFTLCLGTIGFFNGVAPSYAGQTIYQFKDNNGTTLLTNKKKAEYSHLKVVKATYYPDSNIHSYSNWGASEASVLPSYSRNKNAFDPLIRQAAQQHGISEGLIKAVMHTESGFNINARSPVGAQGLMQLMPATARRFNVNNAYDPQQNIFAGAKYLSWLLKRFNGNTQLAIAAYNAGEGNVDKYGGIPPFRETQDYVRRVTSRYQNLYASSIGSSSSSTTQVIAQSANYTTPSTEAAEVAPTPKQYNRQIITLADGTFTDAPSGTYTTTNATASARIRLSD
ncbi:lytic transglycosylase domain-containing protein [Acinetobacter genomosp. 15BJ]|nr:lytic transglycosylase domain-containing protein [Acinetobacter genomosp. 15BJ]MCH7291668.1 lytic transglycosylase domain-containing protein [Acinetobacter genomosp. 15BJ]MDO3658297.1 lytic transglycosylase domain-containing protein [Acinetobacter genomosp. 15BJ]